MAFSSIIAGEEYYRVAIGQGMYTSELPSNIPDGFSAMAYNMVATGDSLENRIGIKRPSVNWNVFEVAAGTPNSDAEKINIIYPLFPTRVDAAFPAFAWASWGSQFPSGASANPYKLNFVRCSGTGTGDGFMSVTLPALCLGICQYQDTVYFTMIGQGVQKITNFNWTADTITYTQVASSAGGTFSGLFTFKDRLWAFQDSNLYFTDVAPVGGLPEQWAFATNRVAFVGPSGAGRIRKIVPLSNKLLVFTMGGLFTLVVEGPPASWILKLLDSRSISTTNQCAFESKGIIYYINTVGVWATNGVYVTKVSGVIEDLFFLAVGSRTHSIVPYEDGMIISVAKIAEVDHASHNSAQCRIFYSKLDPIAWTEWNIQSKSPASSVMESRRICCIYSTSDKIVTFLNPQPVVYSLMYISNSTEAQPDWAVLQLLVFDGGKDQIMSELGTVLTAPVNIYLKTKQMDGGNPYNIKMNKRGLLEMFTSDALHRVTTSWQIDATTSDGGSVRKTLTQDQTVGIGSNLIQIPAGFHYRRCGLILSADLQTDNSQIKIKDIAIVQNTERGEFELTR